jgi:23S rRNA-/tRNA-specific pseudouridylate synthase
MALPPILHEDEFLIAFDKPSGMPGTAERGAAAGESLIEQVQAVHGRNVGAVHRLDPEASGVFLCAKSKQAMDIVSGQFQSKTAERLFLAVCVVLPKERCAFPFDVARDELGRLPDSFPMDLGMDDDPVNKGFMQVFRRKGGKVCLSEFRTLERFRNLALVEGRLITGRHHQLRVHLAGAGAPLLNDPYYGDPEEKLLLSDLKRGYKGRDDEKPLIRRLALHASSLGFNHPGTREPITITAPMPEDFEVALKYLRKFSRPERSRRA